MLLKLLIGIKVFVMLVVFFGFVVGVNVIMMKFVIVMLFGMDVDSFYVVGLIYEWEIEVVYD